MLQKSLETEYNVTKSSLPGIVLESFAADLIFYLGDKTDGDANIEQPVIKKYEKPQIIIKKDSIPEKKVVETAKPIVVEPQKIIVEEPVKEIEEEGKYQGIIIDEIIEEEQIKILTKEIIEKHWITIIERLRTKKEDELATAMETAGVVSYEDPTLYITGENKFFTDKIKKQAEVIVAVLKEEFKKDININIFEKNEYNAKNKVSKDVEDEEAKNNPTVKELSKIFKFSSVEIKKAEK